MRLPNSFQREAGSRAVSCLPSPTDRQVPNRVTVLISRFSRKRMEEPRMPKVMPTNNASRLAEIPKRRAGIICIEVPCYCFFSFYYIPFKKKGSKQKSYLQDVSMRDMINKVWNKRKTRGECI